MGWRELRGWLREMNRQREIEAGRGGAGPDSWQGAENDPFWAEMREKARRLQGH
jgi:hypothetical protein